MNWIKYKISTEILLDRAIRSGTREISEALLTLGTLAYRQSLEILELREKIEELEKRIK